MVSWMARSSSGGETVGGDPREEAAGSDADSGGEGAPDSRASGSANPKSQIPNPNRFESPTALVAAASPGRLAVRSFGKFGLASAHVAISSATPTTTDRATSANWRSSD